MTLQEMLDTQFGADGEDQLRAMLSDGADPNAVDSSSGETPLHVAARRYRPGPIRILLAHGADVDARTAGGKTAYVHALRRGFTEVAELLRENGADTHLDIPDKLAVAVVTGRLEEARAILADHPEAVRTGNPEEDRLLADMTGRSQTEPVELLIRAGADLAAPALDTGTPLHQAAWFGQPANARLLIDTGAPLDVFESTHQSSPIGWATHGSRYSGGAEERQDAYAEVTRLLLSAGCSLHYPGEPGDDAYYRRMLKDAAPLVAELLRATRD